MVRYGFIHTKEEIKFLILYAMGFLTEPVSFDVVVDICTWCDEGFGYFELSEAFHELVDTGHLSEEKKTGESLFSITGLGREAAVVFGNNLPFTVREAAQKSALRVVRKQRRDAAICTSVTELSGNDLVVTLSMDEVFSLEMHVVSHAQASLLEKNFKANAERIYQTILNALIEEKAEENA